MSNIKKWGIVFGFLLILIDAYSIASAEKELTFNEALAKLQERGAVDEGYFLQSVRSWGPPVIPRLTKELSNSNPEVVAVILKALNVLKVPCRDISTKIADKLNDPSWLVRHEALSTLAKRKCSDQTQKVVARLDFENDPFVLEAALDALGLIGDQQVVSQIQTFQDDVKRPWNIRLSAATALLRLTASCNENLLKQALRQPERETSRKALFAFSLTADENIIAEIDPFTHQGNELEEPAKIALAGIKLNQKGNAARQEELFSHVEGEDPYLTRWATRKLVYEYPSSQNFQRLKSIAVRPQSSPDQLQENQLGMQRNKVKRALSLPAQSVVIDILVKEGILSASELKETAEFQRIQKGEEK